LDDSLGSLHDKSHLQTQLLVSLAWKDLYRNAALKIKALLDYGTDPFVPEGGNDFPLKQKRVPTIPCGHTRFVQRL
ncbi:MAG: hypothetical protein V5783_09915, partial [Pontiella sp.]